MVSGISEASAVENAIGGIDIQLWNVKLQTALQNCRDWSGHDTIGPIMSYLIDLVPCLIGWSSLEKQHIMIIVGLSWIILIDALMQLLPWIE